MPVAEPKTLVERRKHSKQSSTHKSNTRQLGQSPQNNTDTQPKQRLTHKRPCRLQGVNTDTNFTIAATTTRKKNRPAARRTDVEAKKARAREDNGREACEGSNNKPRQRKRARGKTQRVHVGQPFVGRKRKVHRYNLFFMFQKKRTVKTTHTTRPVHVFCSHLSQASWMTSDQSDPPVHYSTAERTPANSERKYVKLSVCKRRKNVCEYVIMLNTCTKISVGFTLLYRPVCQSHIIE